MKLLQKIKRALLGTGPDVPSYVAPSVGKPETHIIFVNQVRWTKKGEKEIPWHDGCGGHHALYDAMGCQDFTRGMADGSQHPENIIQAFNASALAAAIKGGWAIHHRVIKRTHTITEEIVESDVENG